MKSREEAAVVILNWNGNEHLKTFLPSVLHSSELAGVPVYVADNGSSDDSLELLKRDFKKVRILSFDKNYGFAGGYNKAIGMIEAEYVILLNSDVSTPVGWIHPLINELKRDELIVACMPAIRSFRQPEFFEYAGAAGGFIDKLGYSFCRGRVFDAVESDYGQYTDYSDIFWATGACMAVRTRPFIACGGFDETYFAHFEEIDLCWRLKNRGYRIRFVPDSVVYHLGGGTLPAGHQRKTFLNYRNNLLTLAKNLSGRDVIWILPLRIMFDILSTGTFIKRMQLKHITAVFRAHMAFIGSAVRVCQFRKKEKPTIVRRIHAEVYPGSVVLAYFLHKKITFSQLKWKR